MKKWEKIWKTWPVNIFRVIGMILFFVLFIWGFFISWENGPDINYEFLHLEHDNIFFNVVMVTLALFIWSAFTWGFSKIREKVSMDQLAVIVAVAAALAALLWCAVSHTQPQSDQHAVSQYAEELNNGDYSSLERGHYLGIHWQQLGLVTLLRGIYFLFGNGNYRAFQNFSCILLALLVFSGYQITKKITEDHAISELTYLCMVISCIPMYLYATFVYGESCSTSMVMFAAWMFLECLEKFSWKYLILFGLSAGIVVQMRANVLIIMIAFAVVIVIKLFQERSKKVFAMAASLILGIFIFRAGVNLLYINHIPEDSKAMPAILYVAMGTNDDVANAGWFNGYNWNKFEECDFEPEAASADAKEVIHGFLQECLDDPAMAAGFYSRKLGAQWEAPMYQCLVMNSCFEVFPDRFVSSVYTGKLRRVAEGIMNIYQLLLYGGVFVYLLAGRKREQHIEHYVLLIGVFGGFLFSAIWEAKSRYVYPYLMMLLPYAAAGITVCVTCISNRIWNRREQ